MDKIRYQAETAAAWTYLDALMRSEVRFYEEEYPEQNHDGGTPTAEMILEGLAGTLRDNLDPDLGGPAFLPDLRAAADREYRFLTEGD